MAYEIERVQTGVRLEKRTLKVLKGLAEILEISLGDLLEGIVLHAFEGKTPFSPATLEKIGALRAVYGHDLGAEASHQLTEAPTPRKRASGPPAATPKRRRGPGGSTTE